MIPSDSVQIFIKTSNRLILLLVIFIHFRNCHLKSTRKSIKFTKMC